MEPGASKMATYLKKLKPHLDKKGWFVEVLKRNEIRQEIRQISAASLKPGAVRGNHYHRKRIEWFFVLGGSAQFCLKNIKTDQRHCFKLSPKHFQVVTVLSNTAHAIKNISKKTIYLLELQNDIYNPKKPDKFPYKLL